MASVCGGTLSLMDAGVPIKAPVAGIAMGLVKEGDQIANSSCKTVREMGFADYFLIVWDFIRFAKQNGIASARARLPAAEPRPGPTPMPFCFAKRMKSQTIRK